MLPDTTITAKSRSHCITNEHIKYSQICECYGIAIIEHQNFCSVLYLLTIAGHYPAIVKIMTLFLMISDYYLTDVTCFMNNLETMTIMP